jgi:guanine nucleotide-binding protein alpha-1 subunit
MGLSPLLSIANSLNQRLDAYTPDLSRDVCVRPGSGWKTMLGLNDSKASKKPSRPDTNDGRTNDEISSILTVCRDDIVALWEDPVVKDVLKDHNVRLEESSGL